MKPLVYYCYDAYCGWCYGFSPVIRKLAKENSPLIDIEVLSGGMIISDSPAPIGVMAPYIQTAYKRVEELSGIKFGEDYLWHVFNPDQSDWFPNSEKPAIAMCIFKEFFPELQVDFAFDLQFALHYEGRDLCDNEAYRHLVEKYELPEKDFYERLGSDEYRQKAYYEFALVKQLRVNGYPTVFLQAGDNKFYLLARGYTDYDSINSTLHKVLKDMESPASS